LAKLLHAQSRGGYGMQPQEDAEGEGDNCADESSGAAQGSGSGDGIDESWVFPRTEATVVPLTGSGMSECNLGTERNQQVLPSSRATFIHAS
jgi:hypothetical protein